MYEEINRLWISRVPKWGCLSDSVFSVFANPDCICTNKKRKRSTEKTPRRWAQLPWSDASILSALCSHACRCVWFFTVFSLLFFIRTTTKKASAAPPQISLIISRCAWHRVYGLICAHDYRCSNKNQVQRRISQHGNMCCKHSEYPELLLDTACHCFECSIFQETLTASLTLPWKEKQTTRHKTGKMCTGILNMGRQQLDLLLTFPSIPD